MCIFCAVSVYVNDEMYYDVWASPGPIILYEFLWQFKFDGLIFTLASIFRLKELTAILAPWPLCPVSHASQTSTSPFHSCKTTKVYICCKHAKTAPKTHCWLRPKPSRHDPFLCWSEILRDEHGKQIKHTFGRPTGLSVPCSPVAMPPWISHYVLPSAAFHQNNVS